MNNYITSINTLECTNELPCSHTYQSHTIVQQKSLLIPIFKATLSFSISKLQHKQLLNKIWVSWHMEQIVRVKNYYKC